MKSLTLLCFVFLLQLNTVFGQKSNFAKEINKQRYTFVANSALPNISMEISKITSKMAGGNASGIINLTESYYELRVYPDSVVAYLPYFGRSYSAKAYNNEGGVKFNSKDFDYKAKKNKKGIWDISIYTKDISEGYRLNLKIAENGFASLYLNSNDKQGIEYSGQLKAQ